MESFLDDLPFFDPLRCFTALVKSQTVRLLSLYEQFK